MTLTFDETHDQYYMDEQQQQQQQQQQLSQGANVAAQGEVVEHLKCHTKSSSSAASSGVRCVGPSLNKGLGLTINTNVQRRINNTNRGGLTFDNRPNTPATPTNSFENHTRHVRLNSFS